MPFCRGMARRGHTSVKIRTFLVCLTCSLGLGSAYAATTINIVGHCTSAKSNYATISAAIAATPANGVIEVCPGTYAEQITIQKPVTITGIVVAGQPGVTITAPASGLTQLPGLYSTYAQIFADNVNGAVNLSNLTVQAGLFNTEYGTFDLSEACNFISDSAGVYFQNARGTLDHLNIVGQYGSLSESGTPSYEVPNCGSGMEFHNEKGTRVTVQESAVIQAGFNGIYASADLDADHNILSVSGPRSAGISAGGGSITNNTITASPYYESTGIRGGDTVEANMVQSASYGITGAGQVRRNMLLNNSISIVGNAASGNLIYARKTYVDPTNLSCQEGAGGPACNLPTVGVNLQCEKHADLTLNGIFDVGVGLANMSAHDSIPASNLFTGDTTISTSCAQ